MTTTINLLPWRAAKREHEKKEFHTLLLSAAFFAFFVLAVSHFFIKNLNEKQIFLNEKIRLEISKLEKDIKTIKSLEAEKKQLVSKIGVIQSLQKNRPEIVHLFNDIVIVLPPGTHFSVIDRQKNNVFMKGFAASNSQVSQLMRNMKLNAGFVNPILNNIHAETLNQIRMIAFDLSSIYSVEKQIQNLTANEDVSHDEVK